MKDVEIIRQQKADITSSLEEGIMDEAVTSNATTKLTLILIIMFVHKIITILFTTYLSV